MLSLLHPPHPGVARWGGLICLVFRSREPSALCPTPLGPHSIICALSNPLSRSALLILSKGPVCIPGGEVLPEGSFQRLLPGTVQGSALSPLLFDLFINALLRLLDSTRVGISHRVRGVPDWNHQAFADDLSLYVGSTEDANTLLDIVSKFQEWSGLNISIKKSLATGALYGRGETQRQKDASAESRKRKAPVLPQYTSKAVLPKTQDLENLLCDSADDTHSDDEDVVTACDEFTSQRLLQTCATCGRNRRLHHLKSESKSQCIQCFKSWIPQGIRY